MTAMRIALARVHGAAVRLLESATRPGGKNIDLSTVPDRDTVQLTIYNSEDLTLVRETRKVSFKPGVNPLQFSWANTLIDPTSVELRFLTARRQAGGARHDLSARQAADALLERPERDRTARPTSRSPTSPAASPGRPTTCCVADADETEVELRGLRPGVQQLGRGVRKRPGAAGGGQDQPGGKDRPVGADPDVASDATGESGTRRLAQAIHAGGHGRRGADDGRLRGGRSMPRRSSRKG